MKTCPAFQFYASDFLIGTMHMNNEEVGIFIRLLCLQWEQGGLPNDEDRLCRLTQAEPTALRVVLEKFTEEENGLLKNPRLEAIRKEKEEFRARQAANGAKGGRRKKADDQSVTQSRKPGKPIPNPSPSSSSPSSSSSSSSNNTTHTSRARTASALPDWAFDEHELRKRGLAWASTSGTSPDVVEAWIEHRLASNWLGPGGRPLQPNTYDLSRFAANYAEVSARTHAKSRGQPHGNPEPTPDQEKRVTEFLRTWWQNHRHEDPENQPHTPVSFAMIVDFDLRHKAQEDYSQWTPQQPQPIPS